ncbi:hypothetical protein M3Y98_01149900 [Aphelenchoides besseyi]|nr:hypothetical protein M3Y98_01149900 [Aphelenchoides besseyi]KAI6210771.1 hypothetical protein M3Y96_00363400 [Aphelenchoides besseyi]
MSRRILLEAKRRIDDQPYLNGTQELQGAPTARFLGPDVIVDDQGAILQLLNKGYYGAILGQRLNFTNSECFHTPDPIEEERANYIWREFADPEIASDFSSCIFEAPMPFDLPPTDDPLFSSPFEPEIPKKLKASGDQWLKMVNEKSQQRLYLSPSESIYLVKNRRLNIAGHSLSTLWEFYKQNCFLFERRFFVYEYFRNQGWTVRPALTFGALYKESPESYHSSVIVRLVDDIKTVDPLLLGATKRHVKNAIYLVMVSLNDEQTWGTVDANSTLKIQVFQHSVSVPAKALT